MTPSELERFEAKYVPDPNSGCWIWTAFCSQQGYGQFSMEGRIKKQAHWVSYTHFVGPIEAGLELDHLCRVRCCINPQHLEPVTHRENMLRGISRFQIRDFYRAITHCPSGHPYAGENLHIYEVNGWATRRCRTCGRERMRRLRASRKTLK